MESRPSTTESRAKAPLPEADGPADEPAIRPAEGDSQQGGMPAPRHSRLTREIARLVGFDDESFLLRIVQPALVGMIDGTVSTLAPIFAAAVSSSSHTALLVGIATALGAGVSMGFSEALSDTGQQTGRGSALVRGVITGGATAVGGIFHSLPFVISNVHTALAVAGTVVGVELFTIAWVRHRFLHVSLRASFMVVTLGGAIVVGIGVVIGSS